MKRLIVVPSEPIHAYENAGYGGWLERYYNPGRHFDEVYALSPLEKEEREAHGMRIVGIKRGEFKEWLDRLRPAVVRGYGGFWASDLVCSQRRPDVPVVVSVHDNNPELIHRSLTLADLVLCTSSIVRDGVVAVGVDSSRIKILPNRVDHAIFHETHDDAFEREFAARFPAKKRLLHVGRKVEQKNLETVIDALTHLPPDYACIFIGRGQVEPYQQLARQKAVEDRCFWVESVKNEDLPKWYSAADCMCTPSLWEGFGIVFIEAAACGAAIVTSNAAPMNEYLVDGQSAALVSDYRSGNAVAAAVVRACEDKNYRATIRLGAVEASKRFSLGAIDALEVSYYEEAIGMPPRTSIDMSRVRRLRFELAAKDAYRNSLVRKVGARVKALIGARAGSP